MSPPEVGTMQKRIPLGLAALAVAAGCMSSSGKGLSVSATGRAAARSASAAAGTNAIASGNVIDAGNGLLITRIRVVVARAEVEGPPACPAPTTPTVTPPATAMPRTARVHPPLLDDHSGNGSSGGTDDGASGGDSHDDGECEIEGGPFLIDLAGADLTSGVTFVVGLAVPAGTYQEVKFKIDTVNATQAGTDTALLAMADAHASILVDGTMDGVAFQFSTSMALQQARQGAMVVDPVTGANVTLDFDASGWFKTAGGGKLDPTDATAQGQILANIRASIRVVSDDDRDGEEDHHGDGGHD
jgi:hypothetical protein